MAKWVKSATLAVLLVIVGCSDAPDIITTQEQKIDLEGLQQPLVVNYFAEWCAPCLRELPELNEFYHHDVVNSAQAQLLGITFDPLSNSQIEELAARHGIDYPLALAQPQPVLPFDRPQMLPATYIIFPDGRVHGPMMGEQTLASLRQALNQKSP